MLQLEAINIIIRGSNKAVINDLDDESQAAQVAKRTLKQSRIDILERGWGFNTRNTTLQLDASLRVPISESYLRVIIPDSKLVVQMDENDDGKLFVWSHHKNVDTWFNAAIIDVKIILDYPGDEDFKRLPQLIAEWIAWKATADFWTEAHDGSVNQKLEAKSVRHQSRWLNTQGDLGNVRDASGFTAIAVQGYGGTTRHLDPRTQSSF